MPDSPIISAWRELLAAQDEAMGTSPQITIGSVNDVRCIIGTDTQALAFFAGGTASTGTMEVQTIYADWGSDIPEKPDEATIENMANGQSLTLQVISTREANGILYITIGDNSAQ